jgi:hypothetical protein
LTQQSQEIEIEQDYITAIHDLCARIDLAISNMLNITTELNNAKSNYLKMLVLNGEIKKK